MHLLLFLVILFAFTSTGLYALDDDLALSPPMGWRSWNLFGENVSQDLMVSIMDALVNKKYGDDGDTSLCDIGYCDIGLDDNWQECREKPLWFKTYHDDTGSPMVNKTKFPDMLAMNQYAHSLGLTSGWYFNNCICQDTCFSNACYEGDVNALVDFDFDGVKLDGCGLQLDVGKWQRTIEATGKKIVIENCHWGWKSTGGVPTADWCPFHFYRTSDDIRANYDSVMGNLRSTYQYSSTGLSRPGCWAYPDMLEVGCRNGPGGDLDSGLTIEESRTHFAAWCIISSPLILGLDIRDDDVMEKYWPVISNREAIQVNQEYYGQSGHEFEVENNNDHNAESKNLLGFNKQQEKKMIYYYKRMSESGDKIAVLMVNDSEQDDDDDVTRATSSVMDMEIQFNDIPELQCANHKDDADSNINNFIVRDIWNHKDLGVFHDSISFEGVAAHDCVFFMVECAPPSTAATSSSSSSEYSNHVVE